MKHYSSFFYNPSMLKTKPPLDFDNLFPERDQQALHDLCKSVAKANEGSCLRFLEIGSWKGCSTSVMASVLEKHNGGGVVYCIDTWKGSSTGSEVFEEASNTDVFSIWRNNMKLVGLDEITKPLIMTSQEAAQILDDESFDLVFIDADHAYSSIISDIKLYLPKVKPGGIISGHDCQCYYEELLEQLPKDFVEAYKEEDVARVDPDIFGSDVVHCGVITALHDMFGKDFHILKPSWIWYKRL